MGRFSQVVIADVTSFSEAPLAQSQRCLAAGGKGDNKKHCSVWGLTQSAFHIYSSPLSFGGGGSCTVISSQQSVVRDGFSQWIQLPGALWTCLPSHCRKWGRLWAVWVSRNRTAGENGKLAIISAFPFQCGVVCLPWGHRGDEVLHRARAAGELQGAEGCGVRVCVVGKWAEGKEGKCLHEPLWSKKRFCVFHQEFQLPSGLHYTTSSQTEPF